MTEGPYWIDQKLTRRDVREGKPGLPLVLAVTVVNARTCRTIKGADVEIWHCDAGGNYSGFDSGSGGGGPGGGGPATSTRYWTISVTAVASANPIATPHNMRARWGIGCRRVRPGSSTCSERG